MKNNYDIKEVRLGKFIDTANHEQMKDGKNVLTCEMDPNIDKELICLIDNKNHIAYDLENLNNSYKILQRNKEGVLINQEIYADEFYVVNISNKITQYNGFIDKLKKQSFKRKMVEQVEKNNKGKAK